MEIIKRQIKKFILFINPNFFDLIKRNFGSSFFRLQLENWLKKIDVKSIKLLDIGGGLNPIKGRTKTWNVQKYMVVDNNLEGNFNPDFHIDLNKITNIDRKKIKNHFFDTIFCLEVMEYIYNPLTVLEFIHSLLAKSGVLYISFPTIYPVHSPESYDYLRYTRQGIIKLLQESGFSYWQITSRVATQGKKNLLNFYKKEKMKGIKKEIVFDIGYMVKAYK